MLHLIPPDKDPLGAAVLEYLDGDFNQDIIVHCDVAADDVLPVKHLFRTTDEMNLLEKTALQHCKGSVLDIGAGAGCHSLALVEKGLEVVSIDISPGAVKAMQQRGLKNAKQVNVMDVKNEHFDTLLLMMNGIGITGSLGGFDDFLQHAKTLLNPAGQIIFDTSDIEYLFMEDDGSRHINLNAAYYGEVVYQMEYKGIKGEKFPWLYLDFITLTDHCVDNGYSVNLLFDDERFNYLVQLALVED